MRPAAPVARAATANHGAINTTALGRDAIGITGCAADTAGGANNTAADGDALRAGCDLMLMKLLCQTPTDGRSKKGFHRLDYYQGPVDGIFGLLTAQPHPVLPA